MKKISVIVPVYNSEAYIEQCVQSLIGQTYQHWEALLIDDGSTDRSPELCESLSRTDGRIKVYHQENKGVSAARNCGLDLAKGEYVYFSPNSFLCSCPLRGGNTGRIFSSGNTKANWDLFFGQRRCDPSAPV